MLIAHTLAQYLWRLIAPSFGIFPRNVSVKWSYDATKKVAPIFHLDSPAPISLHTPGRKLRT
jgi:hypothetical protein